MAKRDAPKSSDSKGKTKAERHSAVTAERKRVRVARQERLAARPGDEVSENCRKSRGKRARRREYLALPAKERRAIPSPSEAGERQYGDTATDAHRRNRKAWTMPSAVEVEIR